MSIEKINVLSLFDGIGGAKVALDNLSKNYTYYSSEINKFAIQVLNKNHSNIIHLGDVYNIKASNLPKIDLLIGGSPCQDLAKAGKRAGLHGNRSMLYFEYRRLLDECKPKYFLLENVGSMSNYAKKTISLDLGVQPTIIDSKWFSAQTRKRYYWTNISIPNNPTPYADLRVIDIIDSSTPFTKDLFGKEISNLIISNSNMCIKKPNKQVAIKARPNRRPYPFFPDERIFSVYGKALALTTSYGQTPWYEHNFLYRKLTPLEAERLQTFPDNYTCGLSLTQRFKLLGNSFTVKVIEEILKGI